MIQYISHTHRYINQTYKIAVQSWSIWPITIYSRWLRLAHNFCILQDSSHVIGKIIMQSAIFALSAYTVTWTYNHSVHTTKPKPGALVSVVWIHYIPKMAEMGGLRTQNLPAFQLIIVPFQIIGKLACPWFLWTARHPWFYRTTLLFPLYSRQLLLPLDKQPLVLHPEDPQVISNNQRKSGRKQENCTRQKRQGMQGPRVDWYTCASWSVLYPFATEEGPVGAETFC